MKNRYEFLKAPINPWLAEKIKRYRSEIKEKKIRSYYEIECMQGMMISWDDFITSRALYETLHRAPFLQTLRANMELPAQTLEGLYWCHVDTVADLLQLSEEELSACAGQESIDVEAVKKYLAEYGYALFHCSERTYKVPSLNILRSMGKEEWEPWLLDSPGGIKQFDISRPFLNDWWCERFFSHYGHVQNEEKLSNEYRDIVSKLSFTEFFHNVHQFWNAYSELCTSHHILPRVHRPDYPLGTSRLEDFPNDRFLMIWRECCRVMVDVFERTALFRHSSPKAYFSTGDEGKLNIAERELEDNLFQLLLITFVENKIDFENVLFEMRDLAALPIKSEIGGEAEPVNPWLAENIREFRAKYPDTELRKRYDSYIESLPEKSWDEFVAESALDEKISLDPFLLTNRKDFGFSEHLTKLMAVWKVDVVSDLLQFTFEEMRDLCKQEGESLEPIVRFITDHGYQLCHYDRHTLKY